MDWNIRSVDEQRCCTTKLSSDECFVYIPPRSVRCVACVALDGNRALDGQKGAQK